MDQSIIDGLKSDDAAIYETAGQQLKDLTLDDDPNLVETLIGVLNSEFNPYVQMRVALKLGKLFEDSDDAEHVIPHLLRMVCDSNREKRVRDDAVLALRYIGISGVRAMLPLLSDANPELRRLAIEGFDWNGPEYEATVPYVIAAIQDPDAEVRDSAISHLRAMLDSDEWVERARKLLNSLLNHESAIVRAAAASLLMEVDPDNDRAAEVAVAGLQSSDQKIRELAAKAFENVETISHKLYVRFHGLLHDESWLVRSNAAEALGKADFSEPDVVPDLVAALEDDNESVRIEAAEALGKKARNPHLCVPALIRLLRDSDELVRFFAIFALGEFGFQAKEALEPLCQLLKDDPFVRNQEMIRHAIDAINGND